MIDMIFSAQKSFYSFLKPSTHDCNLTIKKNVELIGFKMIRRAI
jgi:hypothetical protein